MIIKDTENKGYKEFSIELVQKFAKDIGIKVEFVPTDWKTLVNGIPVGKYDMTTSASITPSRAKVSICGDPYIFFGTIPLDLAENIDKYRSWAEVGQLGITVAVTLGTSFESQAKNFFKNAHQKS